MRDAYRTGSKTAAGYEGEISPSKLVVLVDSLNYVGVARYKLIVAGNYTSTSGVGQIYLHHSGRANMLTNAGNVTSADAGEVLEHYVPMRASTLNFFARRIRDYRVPEGPTGGTLIHNE